MCDQDEKCWQCGRKFKRNERRVLVQMLTEDQSVFVGEKCAKVIEKRGMIESAKGVFIRAELVRDEI